jgi:hypothetical protein
MENLVWLVFVLACPLMMIFMMKGMHGGGHGHDPSGHQREAERDRRIAALEGEIAELRGEVRTDQPDQSTR